MGTIQSGEHYARQQLAEGRALHELYIEARNHPNNSRFKLGMLRVIAERQETDARAAQERRLSDGKD